jgi:mRNA interferase MazF
MYVPDRGHAVRMNFNLQAGHEQAGQGPVLVISSALYNGRTGLVLCCPITSQIKGCPFEVKIEGNVLISGVALSNQLKSLDWRVRGVKFITVVDDSVLEEVVAKFEVLLRSEYA